MVRVRRPARLLGRRGQRGQGLTEFALVAPIFLAMIFGIVDLGRVVWANNSLAGAAREAARYASVHGGSVTTACPSGPMPTGVVPPAASVSCPFPSPSKRAVMDVVRAHAVAGGAPLVVQVCYGLNCTGTTDTGSNKRGSPVTVRVTGTIDLVTTSLLGLGAFTVSGSSTMLVNH
jgi:hypothetical protein